MDISPKNLGTFIFLAIACPKFGLDLLSFHNLIEKKIFLDAY
jgi:hypothetical protein